MKIGTRSVLFGAHQFLIHPLFVALAWWKLYGFPWDPRLWVAFFVHDLGYIGKPNMDGKEGEQHVLLGASIMRNLFDWPRVTRTKLDNGAILKNPNYRWLHLCLLHSRFWAKSLCLPPSKLCMADKLAVALEPWWLYLPRVILSGEVHEYMALTGTRNGSKYKGEPNNKYESMNLATNSIRGWHRGMTSYCRRWAFEHADGRADTWTPARQA